MVSIFSPQYLLIHKLQYFSQLAHSVNTLKAHTRNDNSHQALQKPDPAALPFAPRDMLEQTRHLPSPALSHLQGFPVRPFSRTRASSLQLLAPRNSWLRGLLKAELMSLHFTAFNTWTFVLLWLCMGAFLAHLWSFGTSKQDVPL